ncbi:amino acid/amide ABC transporter membrane protein 2 (HAAT family) [Stella humosa]|uniref:Amino acid/amide ABC transporter membrane protein 2 (HAAT family) n=1 Tax=Stella humosa TaxID=94 RepID=A0A3N1KSW9_9PROT|nr:branched-chain amino acid ABC transporter permease [Stella humosa]ROP81358.1 amino acid/amide ABC transporter membrane protein 2 (HAAT family) [Stella humosa]BBK32708.1 branched-chain amino acid ABC transporter permease [Stella humosa]
MSAPAIVLPETATSRRLRLAAIVAAAALFLALPLAGGEYWIKGVAMPALIYGLAALGLNLLVGCAGQISMGQAAFMAVGAFVGAISYGRYGLPLPLALLAAGGASALVGVVVGLPTRRIRGLYLMVATLAAQVVVLWAIQRVPWFGAEAHGTIGIPRIMLGPWEIRSTLDKYLLVLAVAVPLTLFARNLVASRIGRAWIAIREREVAAEVLGVPAFRYKLFAFAVAAFYGGVAGALVVFAWTGIASVEEYQLELSIKLLGMIIVGGLGSVLGSYLGAAFIALLPVAISVSLTWGAAFVGGGAVNSALISNAEHVVFGLLLLVFLIAEPRGLARLVTRAANRLRSTSISRRQS